MNAPFDPLDERRVAALTQNLLAQARQDLGVHAAILTAAPALLAAQAAGRPDHRRALKAALIRLGAQAWRQLAGMRPPQRPTHPTPGRVN